MYIFVWMQRYITKDNSINWRWYVKPCLTLYNEGCIIVHIKYVWLYIDIDTSIIINILTIWANNEGISSQLYHQTIELETKCMQFMKLFSNP